MKAWLEAFRLRTLPLAFSSIIMGAFLAAREGSFVLSIFIFTLLTTLFLQVLSNLANDYGDFVKGTDNDKRVGPARTVQAGLILPGQMKTAIMICSFLALVSGILLLYFSGAFSDLKILFFFLGLGLLCILAAITYTVGKNAYGYKGLGDISVFLFFGLVGVLGTHYLMAKHFNLLNVLPAISCGLLATGVLNLNNLRDIDNDSASGKRSIPVIIGFKTGKVYQNSLVILALFSLFIYLFLTYKKSWQFMPLALVPVFTIHLMKVNKTEVHRDLDPFLKQLALLSLLTTVVFGISVLL